MITQLTTVTNGLNSLGKPISNDQKRRKIIRAFPYFPFILKTESYNNL